ncbi:MAG TPA: FISUMP domain-containing protein [Bacteroidales bacterium]|nr:FISUMP domain-containing protein [Bacteroidales bacterium]
MKTIELMIIELAVTVAISCFSFKSAISQNVGINIENPDESALVEVFSTDQGVLISRLTTDERDDIPSPATGLILYNTDTDKFNFWDGDSWEIINDLFVSVIVGSGTPLGKGVAINMSGNNPDPSAMLDIQSDGTDKKGLLIPRTTTSAISIPAEGLLIYNTLTNSLSFYDGSSWNDICHENISSTTGSGSFTSDGVGINTNNPDPSAIIDMTSTTMGFLIPRLTDIQCSGIISPAIGLIIYNSTTKCIEVYTGSGWYKLMNDVPGQPGEISGNISLCENITGETYTILAVDGATSYTWTVPSGANITSGQGTTAITVDFGTSSGNICVTANNGCGSSPQNCKSITIVSNPDAIAGSNSPVCEGESLNLTETGGDAITWAWEGPDSFTSNDNNPTISSVTTLASGTYTVTVVDGNGCTASDDIIATVNEKPSASVGSNSPVCAGDNINLNGSPSALSYSWTGPNSFSSSDEDPTITGATTAASGTYYLTVTDSNGCTGVDDADVTVITSPSAPTAGTIIPGTNQIEWNWNTVTDATGYAYNTIDDYLTATDNGTATSYTQTGILPGCDYTLYVWAYNDCGESSVLILNETTIFTCGDNISFTYNGNNVTYGTVTSGNGRCWMDRNLGASQVAVSSIDANAYGHLMQWGRGDDGHQIRTSSTTTTLADTDTPGHDDFILATVPYYDWRSDNNNNRWNADPIVNNPCPCGWRVPTDSEWQTEISSWGSLNAAGAFGSPLKLPLAGIRRYNNGLVENEAYISYYWSSTINSNPYYSNQMQFSSTSAFTNSLQFRASGLTVRCIKD